MLAYLLGPSIYATQTIRLVAVVCTSCTI